MVKFTQSLTHALIRDIIIKLLQYISNKLKELKILREQSRAGSIPAARTTPLITYLIDNLQKYYYLLKIIYRRYTYGLHIL